MTHTIPTSASTDVCTFKIFSEGREISQTCHVLSITISTEVNRVPTATLILVDGEAAKETFAISDTVDWIPGKQIEIKVGYRSQNDTVFKGIVIKHSIKIRKGSSLLVIECKDPVFKMTLAEQSHYYHNLKDSEIMERVIGRHNLSKEVEATPFIHPQLVQYRCTDWDFLLNRADLNGKLCFVENGKITVEKPNLSQETIITLQYSAILELDAEIDTRLQYTALKAQAWNPADQAYTETQAQEPTLPSNSNLSASDLAKVGNQERVIVQHSGKLTEPELRNWANAKLLKDRLAKVRGRVKCQGVATLKPGKLIQLNGVGDRFKGKVFISAVRHQIANGNWESDVQFGMNPDWFTQTAMASPIQLPYASITGLHVGMVTQLENDPAGEQRIQVRMPLINNGDKKENAGIWARVATLDAGSNRGSFFLPELQDEVVVGFFNNDPNQAIILGMLHSSANPAPLTAQDTNHEKGYVSRAQMKMIFNDDKKTFTIETPAGNSLLLSEADQAIAIADQHGNKITMNEEGIQLESIKNILLKANQEVKLEGLQVNAEARVKFKAKAGDGELSAGSGPTVVKGGTVMIN